MNTTSMVMGFGTFDGLHEGHLFFFRELKKLGAKLTVVVSRDDNSERIKGRRPRRPQDERMAAVQATGLVDSVVAGNNTDFFQCIRDHSPAVIGLGYDQKADEEALKKTFPALRLVRLSAFEPHKYKSSLIEG